MCDSDKMQTAVSHMCANNWYTSPHFHRTDRSRNHRGRCATFVDTEPSYLLTTVAIVDRAEPMPSTLLLAVTYIALAQGVLLHTIS